MICDRDRPSDWGGGGLMENLTVREIREAAERGVPVLIPLGVVEQHGYHLPVSTDIHNAYEVCKRVVREVDCLAAPPLNYSFSGGMLSGTINVTPQVMCLMVRDICSSLVAQGFRTLVLVLGHAGSENLAALDDALKVMLRTSPEMRDAVVALAPVWEFSPTFMEYFRQHDYHAGLVETSLMMYWHPELVREEIVEDPPEVAARLRENPDNYQLVERKLDNRFVVPHITQRPGIKVGVMGFPHRASAEIGRRICGEMVAGLVELIRQLTGQK